MRHLQKKYSELPRAHKSELKATFRRQFEYRSDSIFKNILAGTHFPTPLQSTWLETKIEEYYNHAQGICEPLRD